MEHQMRNLLSIADLEQSDFLHLVERSAVLATGSNFLRGLLIGKSIGIYFRKTSTRTRTSFIVAASRLGACPVVYGPNDLQTNTGETIEDTARVLSGYLDAIVIRTATDPQELRAMAAVAAMPIVNAMTADEHPTQAISDFAMLKRQFGRLGGIRLIYLGEGNNTAVALALAASRIDGFRIEFLTPRDYGLPRFVLEKSAELCRRFGGSVSQRHDVPAELEPADAIYTTRWQTTGTSKNDPVWREKFQNFRVTASLITRCSRDSGTVFMHDLPAVRGEDCDSSVLDGPHSIAFEQARQKLSTAMAIYEWCVPI
jgi:ornithine carbamoyltransferase